MRPRLAWRHAKVGRERASAGRVSGTHKCATAPVWDASSRIWGLVPNKHSLGATRVLQGGKVLLSGMRARAENGEPLKQGQMRAEFGHGASLKLPWTAHRPTQAGSLLVAPWLFPGASSRCCSASDANMPPWAPDVAALGVHPAAVSQDGVRLAAQLVPISHSGSLSPSAVIYHTAENSTRTHPSNAASNL